jgi:xylan 1,4-beta-xylosidase
MGGQRVAVDSDRALPLASVRDAGVRGAPDIAALASRDDRAVSVLVWNYHDDEIAAAPAEIHLIIDGVRARRPTLTHDRVDLTHSNAYEAWKRMGAPQPPTRAQYADLEQAGRLQALEPPRRVDATAGHVRVTFALPRQAVSLVRVTW